MSLEHDHLIAVFADSQRGTGQIDGPESLEISYDKERIQAVFYRRTAVEGELAPLATKSPAPHGCWVLAERIIVEDVGPMAQMPDGDLVGKVGGRIRRSSDGGRTWYEVKMPSCPTISAHSACWVPDGGWLLSSRRIDYPSGKKKPGWVCVVGIRLGRSVVTVTIGA